MNRYAKIDMETGRFIEDVVLDVPPTLEDGTSDPTFVATPCPPGFYWPRWYRDKWVEGGTAPELVAPVQTPEQRIAELEATVADLITAMEAFIK